MHQPRRGRRPPEVEKIVLEGLREGLTVDEIHERLRQAGFVYSEASKHALVRQVKKKYRIEGVKLPPADFSDLRAKALLVNLEDLLLQLIVEARKDQKTRTVLPSLLRAYFDGLKTMLPQQTQTDVVTAEHSQVLDRDTALAELAHMVKMLEGSGTDANRPEQAPGTPGLPAGDNTGPSAPAGNFQGQN